jgi:hypothetical protein
MPNAKRTVTAAEVREFFNSKPERMNALSPEARATVERRSDGRMPRGRLSPEAADRHNKVRRGVQYVTGATGAAKAEQKAAAVALREQAAKSGYPVGKRGPLPKAFVESLKA